MYTSMLLTVLAGLVAGKAPSENVAWSPDYSAARQTGQNEKKPVAVFLGSGENGHDKVCRDGSLSKEAQEALRNHYVCVYVDMSTPSGKSLAKAFEIRQPAGLVLSDRSGEKQAFFHDGAIGGADLVVALNRFADPNLVVRTTTTELYASQRVSNYPPLNGGYDAMQPRMSYYPPVGYGAPAYVGGGCPGGNCGAYMGGGCAGGRCGRR
jgi:hypothetical protein